MFIGVSGPGIVSARDIATMGSDPIASRWRIINNSLAFPGIFRGALDVQATDIDESMKLAAAEAIAGRSATTS